MKKNLASGYEIINVLVDDPQPSDDLRKAFDRVISAKRLKEAAENEGQAARVLAVAKAEAEGQSLEIKGQAYAKFRKIVAQGNSQAIEEFCQKVGLRPKDALDFFTSINEMEAVRDAAAHGGRVVFVASSAATHPNAPMLGMIQAQPVAMDPAQVRPLAQERRHEAGYMDSPQTPAA